tara:strand:+ start:31 stop:1047 length:1017 start_codon:yes stop_codon:yes gene_type:complete
MFDDLDKYQEEIRAFKETSPEKIENFRIKYLGKKGILNDLFAKFKLVPVNEKKQFGRSLNILKDLVLKKLEALKSKNIEVKQAKISEDLSRTAYPIHSGSRHPISIVTSKIIDIFSQIGFNISEGPEIEDDWHNFTALNLEENHPARDMQDTFFIQSNPDILLRTHTSSVQVRYMEKNTPPIRTISPGRVYRNEAISSRSHCIFHQVEGLYIDNQVSFSSLKQIILYFTKALFGKSKIRFRPSYFPFTEPSAEVDIFWGLESEADYRITKGTGWLEIMGCGMVDPNVLSNCKIDSEKFSGYAFGIGIERIAMLLYQIDDIRLFFENDIRFLEQFKGKF